MKEIIDTKITDKWGVTWDEMEVVRDFLQNFYDANPIDAIQITITDTTAEITAPEIFDYQQLIYLGSHKKDDESSIGQYGEGWKAALLNAMRNWNCDITFIVGNRQLHYFFEKATIGKGEMQILKCEVSELNTAFEGSKLIVKNCTKKLLAEFTFGLKYFYHEKNPLFASLLEKTYSNDATNDIFIYKSSTSEGYVFYKKLMRSKIDVPLVIVCNRSYVNVDKEIAHDRDRKAFKKDVLDRLLKYIFKNFNNHYMKSILPEFQPFWEKGHWLLALIAETRAYNDWKVSFPDHYYAKGKEEKEDMELRLEMSKVQAEFDHLNYHSCPSYMSKFKMKSIRTVAEEMIKKRKEVLNKTYTRGLTSYEKLSINILSEFIKELSHDLYKNFENAKYTVGQNDEVIGELKQKRNYREQHIFLNKVFFTFSFSDALAVLLHEWAHIYGSDGSRTFSDALTYFIALILKNESIIQNLKQWEQKWTQSIQLIESESDRNSSKESLQSVKNSLTPTQMKLIIEKIPDEDFFLLYNQS